MRSAPRSRLLLIELFCDLVIFALCAAVCVALLAQARSMSRESTRLTQAVYIAQDAAERWRAGRPLYDFYRSDGSPDASDLAPELRAALPAYYVAVLVDRAGSSAEVSVYPSSYASLSSDLQRPIYTLTVAKEAYP